MSSDAPDASSAASKAPQFAFTGYWVENADFHLIDRAAVEDGEERPRAISYELQVGAGYAKHGPVDASVSLTLRARPDAKWQPYEVAVTVGGRFKSEADTDERHFDAFCRHNALAILFPYAREMVHRITSDAPYGGVKLAPVNMSQTLGPWTKNDSTPEVAVRPDGDHG